MANRWERFKAIFSKATRERLEEENLRAAEDWLYARHKVEMEDYSPGPDQEDVAERKLTELGSIEDERIAEHEQLGRDDAGKAEERAREAKPMGQAPERSDYERMLDDAADMAKYRSKDRDRGGPDR